MTIPKDLKERMILKLQSYDDGYDYDEDEAIRLIKNRTEYIPDKCLPNFYEWLNNKNISDIKVKGLSIRDIMYSDYNFNQIHDFIMCLPYFNDYCKNNYKDKEKYLYSFWDLYV